MSKNDIISKVYYDFGGYGSIKRTLTEAMEIDPTIKEQDVKDWKGKTLLRKTKLRDITVT